MTMENPWDSKATVKDNAFHFDTPKFEVTSVDVPNQKDFRKPKMI